VKVIRIKWRVEPRGGHTGFTLFQRGWPRAFYPDDAICAYVFSDSQESYTPRAVRENSHGPLALRIAKYDENGLTFSWQTLVRRFETLEEAKEGLAIFLLKKPEFMPVRYRAH